MKFKFNSITPKFYRYYHSFGLNDNDPDNQISGKNFNFFYSNNKPLSNNLTLDINSLSALIHKSPNSNKKNILINKFNKTENIISNNRYNNLENGIIIHIKKI